MKRTVVLALVLLAVGGVVDAQEEKGFVVGNVGITFAEEAGAFLGASGGVNLAPSIQIVGTFSYMTNVLTGEYADFLATTSAITGVLIDGTIPTTYGGGGVRFSFSGAPRVRFFIQVEGGVAKVSPDLTYTAGGTDVTSQVGDLSDTVGSLALDFGARGDLSDRAIFQAGFRFQNLFTDPNIRVTELQVGFGVKF